MRFTTINKLPKPKRYGRMGRRQAELQEFVNMNVKCVKVTLAPNEYANLNTAYVTLWKCIKRGNWPIKLHRIDGELYFIRTDI